MNKLPPTYKFIIESILPPGNLKILDLGCGKGVAADVFNEGKRHKFTGVDIHKPYLQYCDKQGNYSTLIKSDLIKFKPSKKQFDVTLILQVLEHLEKEKSILLLKKSENASKQCVIVSVPNGDCEQDEYDNNPFQRHKSSWSVVDFRRLGYKVYGQGLKSIYGTKSFGSRSASPFRLLVAALGIFAAPFVYFFPQYAAQIIAVKRL